VEIWNRNNFNTNEVLSNFGCWYSLVIWQLCYLNCSSENTVDFKHA